MSRSQRKVAGRGRGDGGMSWRNWLISRTSVSRDSGNRNEWCLTRELYHKRLMPAKQ